MPVVSRWTWIRHAPVEAVYRGQIIGSTEAAADLPGDPAPWLSQLGPVDTWMSSPLQRARQTARWLGAPEVYPIEPGFAEQDFGDWEGKRWSVLMSQDSRARLHWAAYDRSMPPGGESLELVQQRAWRAFEMWSRRVEDRQVAVVAHAGVIRCILAQCLGMPLDRVLTISIDPLSLTVIEGHRGSWQVRHVNLVPGEVRAQD
jgi:broad specificity phosphatase PhoE